MNNFLEAALSYARKGPQYNIGIKTGAASGLWVLDADGKEGIESLNLEDIGEDLSGLRLQSTEIVNFVNTLVVVRGEDDGA